MPDLDFSASNDIDSSIQSFGVNALGVAIGNNKSMISILNASASGVFIEIREVRIINTQTTAITGIISQFDFFRFTGHSVGTSLTPFAFDTSDTLDSDITVRTGATITGESTKLMQFKFSSDEWGVGTPDVESNDHIIQNIIPIYKHSFSDGIKPITLRQGEGFHIKHVINSTAGSFDLMVLFTQRVV